MLILQLYVIFSYAAGTLFTILTLSDARMLTVADVLMLLLSPFAIMPIILVQIISQCVDIDKPVIKL